MSASVRKKSALFLLDRAGRTYWNGLDPNNNINIEWVNEYKQSSMYDVSDSILLVKNKRCDSDNYTEFPTNGPLTFLTCVPPPSVAPDGYFHVTSNVVHTSYHEHGARARKMCYIVVRGGFRYV